MYHSTAARTHDAVGLYVLSSAADCQLSGDQKNVKPGLSVLLIYLLFTGLFVLFWVLVWPTLREQIQNFIDNTPYLVEGIQNQFNKLQNDPSFSRFFKGGHGCDHTPDGVFEQCH
ncbi:AI-2E family transporter [Paenibacillus rhizoplanae]